MDIRTKLALALVSSSLLGMLLLGTFASLTTFELLRADSERRLEALAEGKQVDLQKVVRSWRDRVRLIGSRTRLRALLQSLGGDRDLAKLAEIRAILADAAAAIRGVERVSLFDAAGQHVVTVGTSPVARGSVEAALGAPGVVHFGETVTLGAGAIAIPLRAAVRREGETIGALELILDGADLLSVTQDYTGLGDSGETALFVSDGEGRARVLNPLRHDADRRHVERSEDSCPSKALAGEEGVWRDGMRDYRGEAVWCATRTLAEVGWGLVVKLDEAEELAPARWLRDQVVDLGLALGALAILGGTLLGMRLGRPLRELTDVVERIRHGEHDLRADASTNDEVGSLAEALNELLDEQQKR